VIAVLTVVFLALMVLGALGTGTFVVVYLRSDWRSSAIGRHLLFYSAALCFLYLTSIVSFFVHALWMAGPLLIGHAVFDALIWQRVYLVVKAQREG
jgi:hypothetical protein